MYNSLPLEMKYHILSYNRHFVIKNGRLVTINRLDMSKYNLEKSPKVHMRMYPLHNCIYGYYVRIKNIKFRLYYREIKETNEIEIIFECVSKYNDDYYVEWHSSYIS